MATIVGSPTANEKQTARGADLVCVALERAGADVIFGYPGGASLPIYDALPDHPGLRHILVRHEQGATHMADGYARATGRAGVVLVTSGPGATNLVTGLANAMMDSIPMVAITGQVATAVMGRDAFQETDVLGVVMPVTKHAYLVRKTEDIIPTILRAFEVAHQGRPGPVLVDIPKDVLNGTAPISNETWTWKRQSVDPDPIEITRAAELLAAAQKPLIISGHGVRLASAHAELRTIAERLDAPVAMTLLGIGGFPEDHALAGGMLGMHGNAPTNRAVNDADVILAVGIRFDDRVTGKISAFAPKARIIHIDIDPTQIGKNVVTTVGIVADAKSALKALIDKLAPSRKPKWRDVIAERRERARPRLAASEER
ncbi:MAG: acetolactate synthase large subunit, partial [Chloroflexi bacterium]|nr:acetolactate synthase large subunit [Chloroflexota bacterium]